MAGGEPRRFDIPGPAGRANADIISGYRFVATMQLRTPLRVLRRHGEMHVRVDTCPPHIAQAPWEGVWVPVTKTFRELGLDIDDPPIGTMASSVGQIPADGGEFLKFLIAARSIAEGSGSTVDKRRALAQALRLPSWEKFVLALGGMKSVVAGLGL